MKNLIENVVALCKRRGFIFPGSEIYGGMANSWDYGPLGVELKNNIKQIWWKRFVHQREDIVGIDAALIMNPKVWEASGHLANFQDPLVECKKCHERFRVDHIKENTCLSCGAKDSFTAEKMFNLMFKTLIGPAEELANVVYFRPETAQAMFVNFKQILESTRLKLPFGIAQIGKAFRNEVTPGNFIFRTREFEQMEIEYFIPPPKSDADWQSIFEHFRKEILSWIKDDLSVDISKIHEREIPEEERAHYSKRTIDFDYEFPFGTNELYGLAYRTDFDLKNHEKYSGQSLKYKDPDTGQEFIPHVIEPTWGVDRSVLVVLLDAYRQSEGRIFLKINKSLAPIKVAVFPLLANKPDLIKKAREIYRDLKKNFVTAWDDRGNIGGRYASQDEIGTPFCVTVDFQSLEDEMVTVRDRDTTKQERIKIVDLKAYLSGKINIV